MPARSAGLLPYRFSADLVLEVLVVHPGGPFWADKDDGAWSIAKGEYEPGQEPAGGCESRVCRGAGPGTSPRTEDRPGRASPAERQAGSSVGC